MDTFILADLLSGGGFQRKSSETSSSQREQRPSKPFQGQRNHSNLYKGQPKSNSPSKGQPKSNISSKGQPKSNSPSKGPPKSNSPFKGQPKSSNNKPGEQTKVGQEKYNGNSGKQHGANIGIPRKYGAQSADDERDEQGRLPEAFGLVSSTHAK